MSEKPLIFVVDDDSGTRMTVRLLLENAGFSVKEHESAQSCLDDDLRAANCLVSDMRMPQMNGLELLEIIRGRSIRLSTIFMTGHGDIPLAVAAMKAGAADFLEKPFSAASLLFSVEKAVALGLERADGDSEMVASNLVLAGLTPRERQVFDQLVAGKTHKLAARTLGMSYRTIEVHRAHIKKKLGASGISDMVRISLASSTMLSR